MSRIAIRSRLTAWFSAVLLAGLAIFGAAMWLALNHRLLAGVDAELEQRVAGLRTTLELEGDLSRKQLKVEVSEFARETPEGSLMDLRDAAGPLLPAARRFDARGAGFHTVEADGRRYRVLVSGFDFHGKRYDATVGADLERVRGVLRDFERFLLLTIPAVLLLAAAGGYWLSRRALAPVDEITRVARSISAQNLSLRLVAPDTGDELQRMSETWNGVLERLEGAVNRIRQFTADASHELRTPVALIRATAELALRRDRTAAEYQQALRQIQEEAERMTELTAALLALARSDAGGGAFPLAPVDAGSAAAAAAAQVEAAAVAKGIRVAVDPSPEPRLVRANEAALRRLLLILLDNAIKYTPAGGLVSIAVGRAEKGVRVAVEDTGEGIPPEVAPHIFERFYRADAARARDSGAGLGLSIAQAIAQAHGAEISVESEPGKGSRFSFVLPEA